MVLAVLARAFVGVGQFPASDARPPVIKCGFMALRPDVERIDSLQPRQRARPGLHRAGTGEADIHLHQLHDQCHSRIRYKKTCPIHGEVPNDQIVTGYEYEKDTTRLSTATKSRSAGRRPYDCDRHIHSDEQNRSDLLRWADLLPCRRIVDGGKAICGDHSGELLNRCGVAPWRCTAKNSCC